MLLPNTFVGSGYHLNHPPCAGRTYGVSESVTLIEGVKRQNVRVNFAAIVVEKPLMVRVFYDYQMFRDVNYIVRNTHTIFRQMARRILDHRRYICIPGGDNLCRL